MDDPIELSNVSVSANGRENEAVYEVLSQHRRQEDEYMTIGTAIKGDTIKHLQVDDQQRKFDKIEQTLGGLATTLKILKWASVILAFTVVVISATFGVLIKKQVERTEKPEHESINGGWSSWSNWSTCSSTCGPGLSQRLRSCSNPTPALNGRGCTGDSTDKRLCETKTCAVNGGWSSWSSWSLCSSTCGPGLSERLRTCSNPIPAFDGRECTGDSTDKRLCETKTCAGLQIGFSASGKILLSTSIVQFDTVETNYGSGYSLSTGKFTCSHPGLYYFSTSLIKERRMNNKVDWIFCYIFKNVSDLIETLTDPTDDDTDKGSYETSAFVVVHLSQGDQVYVKCTNGELNSHSSFSGFLIQSD